MKKLLIFGIALSVITPAFSGYVCRLNTNYLNKSSCTFSSTAGSTDWSATCTFSLTNSPTIKYYGVAICGTNAGSSTDTANITLPADGETVYCYCKVISPVNNKNPYRSFTYSSYASCYSSCPSVCASSNTLSFLL